LKTCPAFTRYQGKAKPRCHCVACWAKYFAMNKGVYMAISAAERLRTRDQITAIIGDKLYKMYCRVKAGNE
jgi:hypothetical protein